MSDGSDQTRIWGVGYFCDEQNCKMPHFNFSLATRDVERLATTVMFFRTQKEAVTNCDFLNGCALNIEHHFVYDFVLHPNTVIDWAYFDQVVDATYSLLGLDPAAVRSHLSDVRLSTLTKGNLQ